MIVKIREICGKQILIRQQIVKLRDCILNLKEKDLILDFDGVKLVTRASADEFLKVLEYLKSKNYQIKITNLENEPKKIIEIVSNSTQ
ncbi:MAG: hypothetical protein ACP5JU_02845 [Minisyncoccia bacterium]